MQNGFEAYEDDGTRELPQKVYQVRVVTALDPQVFWLELVRKSSLDPYQDDLREPAILQAGLLNIFPTEFDAVEPFFKLQWNASKTWMPAAIATLRRLLEQADTVYFRLQKELADDFSLIENVKCFFGQLYVSKDGILEDVSKVLTERCLAYKSSSRTKRYSDSNTMFLQRDPQEIANAKRDVLAYQTESRRKEMEARKKAEDAIQKSVNTVRSEVNQIKKSLPSYLKRQLQEDSRYSQREMNKALQDMERVLEECVRDVADERFGESFRARTVPVRGVVRQVEPARKVSTLQSTLAAYKDANKCKQNTDNPETAALPEKKKFPRPSGAVTYLPAGLALDNFTSKQLKESTDTSHIVKVVRPSILSHYQVKKATEITHNPDANLVETEAVRSFTCESKWADSCDSKVCVDSSLPALKEDDIDDELDFQLIPKNAKIFDSDGNSRSVMSDIIAKFKQSQQSLCGATKQSDHIWAVERKLNVNIEEPSENNRVGFIVKENQKYLDNLSTEIIEDHNKYGNADSSYSTTSESRSISSNPVSSNDGIEIKNVPEYRKVCKKKMKAGRDMGEAETPQMNDVTSSSGYGLDDYKKYKQLAKRSNKTKPFKPKVAVIDPQKGLEEFMNTPDYCLIDGSKPSHNRFHTSKCINAIGSIDNNDKLGATSSNIFKPNDYIPTDRTSRREVSHCLKESDTGDNDEIVAEVDSFFKGFKKNNVKSSPKKSFLTCEDLEKSFDSDRTSVYDSSLDTTGEFLPTYSSHSISADVKYDQEQKAPVKPRLSFDIIKRFSQLNKSKTLDVSNDMSKMDAGTVNVDDSVSRIEPNIGKHEDVKSKLDTTTGMKESNSYNIILQVLKRKRDRLAAINASKTADVTAENVDHSGSNELIVCEDAVKETEENEKVFICKKSATFSDVNLCVDRPSDEKVDLSPKQVDAIFINEKKITSDSERLNAIGNLAFTKMEAVDDVIVDETKIHVDVESNSNMNVEDGLVNVITKDNLSFSQLEEDEKDVSVIDDAVIDGGSETKIQPDVESISNVNVEDVLEIKTDESICGSEPCLQSDEDPELIEESDSLSCSNSQDCSVGSFSSSSALKARGLGLLVNREKSIKSSGFLSDKSYYTSPFVEVNEMWKARQSKVLKEYTFDGNRSCREVIAEEGTVSRTDLKSTQEYNRVPFNSGDIADFDQTFIQDDYIQSLKEYNSDEHSQLGSGLIESILTPKVIVHSKSGEVSKPWRELTSTMFSMMILTNLEKMGIKVPRKIQSSVWPTISRGGSTFVVGPAGSGKGLSILAPVCSQLSRMNLNNVSGSNGPVVLILCPDIKTARNAHMICTFLLNGCTASHGKSFSLLRIDDCDNSQNIWSFFKPCEILISTPQCLSTYMKYEVNILNFERVQYLIMENLDILDERFSQETNSIIDFVKKVANKRKCTDLKMYATSNIWCNVLKRIAKESYNPTLVISALQECVFYSGMQLQVRFAVSESKINRLREILQESGMALKRSVIVCESDAEVSDVVVALKSDNHMVLKADTSMTLEVLNEVRLSWRICKLVGNLILVCCDENLQFLDVVNANWLIHFSLPKTFSKFNLRFSTMATNYPNLYLEVRQKTQKLKVDIFVDEMNSLQLPKIVEFVKRCDVEVPANIDKLMRDILNLKDLQKAELFVPLCDRLMGFGDCPNKWSCVERHSIVQDRDKPADWIPRVGLIKCKVVLVHHSSLFSVRLLEHTDLNGVVNTVQQKNLLISMEMAAFFSSEPNRRCHGFAKLGDVCAVKINRSYERCQVIKIIQSHNKKHSNLVLLNLLEEESFVWKNACDLVYLPEHLKEMKSTVVKVRMVGLKPAGSKECWSATSVQRLRSKFSTGDNIFLKGKILLGIGNTLWLENVQICKRLECLRLDAVKCNLKQYLLSEFAVENPSHLVNLYSLCETFHYELPLYAPPQKHLVYKQKLPEIQWAHLNEDQYTDVYFSSGVDPDSFFVRISSHQKTLDDMQNEIQTHVDNLKRKLVNLPGVSEDMINGGFYCLAKFEDDGRYYRARVDKIIVNSNHSITNLTSLSDDNITYKCFFVDHGDWKILRLDELFPINAKFVSRMPFQAIECRLFGLKPLEDSWTNRETDFLYDFSFIDDTEDLKELSAKYYTKSSAKVTTGNKYGILLADKESGKTYADSFIDDNMGEPIVNELTLMNQDSDNLKKYLSLPEESNLDNDNEEDGSVAPIPDFILQQALTSYVDSDHLNPVDIADKLSDWNSMFTEFNDSDDNTWDCTFDAEDFEEFKRCHKLPGMPKLCKIDELSEKGNNSPKSVEDFVMVHNGTPTVSKYLESPRLTEVPTKPGHMTPQILWYQNEKCVTVKILLPDVNIYECKIQVKSLYFETYTNDNIYKVELELYGGIVPEKCSHISKGSYVFIRLCKMTRIEWDFLTVNKEKRILYDHDFVYIDMEDSDMEEEQKRLKEGIKARAGELIYDDGDECDGDEADDILKNLPFIDTDPVNRELLRQLHIDENDDDLLD